MAKVSVLPGVATATQALPDIKPKDDFERLVLSAIGGNVSSRSRLAATDESARRWRQVLIDWKTTIETSLRALRDETANSARLQGRLARFAPQACQSSVRRRELLVQAYNLLNAELPRTKAALHALAQKDDAAKRAARPPEVDLAPAIAIEPEVDLDDFVGSVSEIVRPWFEQWKIPDEVRAAWPKLLAALERRFNAMRKATQREAARQVEEQHRAGAARVAELERSVAAMREDLDAIRTERMDLLQQRRRLELENGRLDQERRSAVLEADRYRKEAQYLATQWATIVGTTSSLTTPPTAAPAEDAQ